MRNNKNQYSAIQSSPQCEIWGKQQRKMGMYTHMLSEDFTRGYSIDLSMNRDNYNFYKIEPLGDPLGAMLSVHEARFLEYGFDKILSEITQTLIMKGKAYVEVVLWKDHDGSVKGISFHPLKPIFSFIGPKKAYFVSQQFNNRMCPYYIDRKRLIIFDLHNLGYSRRLFTRVLKKIDKLNVTGIANLSMDENLKFDFTKYNSLREYNLLKYTRKIYWYGRDSSNQYMNGFYLIWRGIKLQELKKHILDYLLEKINATMFLYHDEANFSGKIIANCKKTDYAQDFEKLMKGEISLSQFSDVFYSTGDNSESSDSNIEDE